MKTRSIRARVTDALGIEVRSAMICCKEQHARRALMYYETLYPDAEFIVCPVSAQGITRDNWTKTEAGIDAVLDELARCRWAVSRHFEGKASII